MQRHELTKAIETCVAEIIQESAVIDKPFFERSNLTKVVGLLIMIGRSPAAKALKPEQSDVLDSLHGMVKFKAKVRSFMASNKIQITNVVKALKSNSAVTKLITKVLSKKGLLGKGGVLGIFEDFNEIKSRKRKLLQISVKLEKLLSIDNLRFLDGVYHVAMYGEYEKPIPPEFAFNHTIKAKRHRLDVLLKQVSDIKLRLLAFNTMGIKELMHRGNHNATILLNEMISSEDYHMMVNAPQGSVHKLWKTMLIKYHPDKNRGSEEEKNQAEDDSKAINRWYASIKNFMDTGGSMSATAEVAAAEDELARRAGIAPASTSSTSSTGSTYPGGDGTNWTDQQTHDYYQGTSGSTYEEPPAGDPGPGYSNYGDDDYYEQQRRDTEAEYERMRQGGAAAGTGGSTDSTYDSEQHQADYDRHQKDMADRAARFKKHQNMEMIKKILYGAGIAVAFVPVVVYYAFLRLLHELGLPTLQQKPKRWIQSLYEKIIEKWPSWKGTMDVTKAVLVDLPRNIIVGIYRFADKIARSELVKILLMGAGIVLMAIPKAVLYVLQKILSKMTLENLKKLDPRKLKILYNKLMEKLPSGTDIKDFSKKTLDSLVSLADKAVKFLTPKPKKDENLSSKDIAKQVEKIAKTVHDKGELMKQFQDHLEKSVTDGELSTKQAVKLANEHLAKLDDMINNAEARLRELELLLQAKNAEHNRKTRDEDEKTKDAETADKKKRATQAKKNVRKKFGDKFNAKFESIYETL